MKECITRNPAETMALAARLARDLRPGDLITLAGELGAGKTCFVRGLAEGLGLNPGHVSSPTFVMVQEYTPETGFGVTLVHVDAYRISSEDDLASIGWEDLCEGNTIVALEWPERIASDLSDERIEIELEHIDDQTRRIVIHAREPGRVLALDTND